MLSWRDDLGWILALKVAPLPFGVGAFMWVTANFSGLGECSILPIPTLSLQSWVTLHPPETGPCCSSWIEVLWASLARL